MFAAFREPDYRRFWAAQFLSSIGSWMQAVAQGWLVYRLTDSAFLLGLVGFAATAPAVVLMLPGGVLADQLDRRRVIACSKWAQAGSALWVAISIAIDRIDVLQIIGAALVVGIAQSFSAPAHHAMTVDLLEDRSRLSNAIALNWLQVNLSRVVGPLIASVALSAWGPSWCFFINAITFLPVIYVLGRTTRRQQENVGSSAMLTRLREGVAYVRQDRLVLLLLSAAAAGSLFGYPIMSLMPVLARKLFRDDAAGNGYLFSAIGAGALLAALLLSTGVLKRMVAVVVVATVAFGASLAAVGLVMSARGVLVLMAIAGMGMVTNFAACNIAIQERTPDAVRGRVMSMFALTWFATVPVGNIAAGALADRAGIELTLAMLGALLMATGVAVAIAGWRLSVDAS